MGFSSPAEVKWWCSCPAETPASAAIWRTVMALNRPKRHAHGCQHNNFPTRIAI
jgi:hypothetical protein